MRGRRVLEINIVFFRSQTRDDDDDENDDDDSTPSPNFESQFVIN